ncbi:MAG: hypothetical protein H7Y38_02695 [Armatimonadetes bacterium]|nr:hypothetical protein [Armatimonadota bacterium]
MSSEENSNTSAVCAAVRLDMESVRDGRATSAERAFVTAHIGNCPACASEWAFAKAAKSAWGQLPTAYPPASLSARIAAATYRKPTFAQRFVAAFAFLNPVPVRVAVGVAAVAGIAFFALPRQGAMMAQNPVALPEAKPETVVATVKPVAEKAKSVETVKPASVVVAAKPVAKPVVVAKSVVATAKPVAPAPQTVVAAVSVAKSAPKPAVVAPVALKKTAPQVAIATPKPVRVQPAVVASKSAPVVAETTAPAPETLPTAPQIAPVKPASVVAAVEKPVVKEPTVSPATTVAGMTVGERENNDGYIRLGSQLANAGRRISHDTLRGGAVVAQNNPTFSIVSAPIKQ